MGSLGLHCANLFNSGESRTFRYTQQFYSIFRRGRKKVVFGEIPERLASAESISQRIWEQHRSYLKRLENFPLKKAAYYRELKESTGVKSVRGLSEFTGEDWSYIAKVLRTLELPTPIQDFLNTHKSPEVVKHFHLRRLLELVRLEEELQFNRFREMLEEVHK